MSARPRIFVSAVSKELGSARQAVAKTLIFLGYEPEWQELFGTEQGDVKEMLRRKIDTCQGFIQLTGQRFGFGPTNPESDEHAVSYTQYELHYARERALKVWPVILAEEFPADAPNDESEAQRQNQRRYRQSLAPELKDHPPVPLYQRAANLIELENVVLKLRNDFEILRTGWTRQQRRTSWAIAGVAVCGLITIGLVCLVKRDTGQTQTAASEAKTNTAQLKIILTDYIDRRTSEAARSHQGDEVIREHAVLNELDKKYGLSPGTLTNQLPAFAKKLASDGTATAYERAQGAFAARDYVEAERLALLAAAEAKKALPLDKSRIIKALVLAGGSAYERRDHIAALAYFTAANSFADKSRDPVEWARINHSLAFTLGARGEHFQAESLFRQVVSIFSEQLGPEHLNTLRSRNNLANALNGQGKDVQAEAEYRTVLKVMERVLGSEHRDTLGCQNNIASALYGQWRFVEAEAEYRAVLKLSERVLGPEHSDTLNGRNNLAMTFTAQGKYKEAEAEHREVLKIMERVLGREHRETLENRMNLASALSGQKKNTEAEVEFRVVIQIMERVLGREHPSTLNGRNNLATALAAQGKHADAEAELRLIIKLDELASGSEHPHTLMTRCNLAHVLGDQRKYAEAEAELRAVLTILERVSGHEHPATLSARFKLAFVLRAQGKSKEAEEINVSVLKVRERVLGSEHPDTLSSRNNVANALAARGKFAEAEAEHRVVLAGRERILGPEHPETLISCKNLALSLKAQGKLDEARKFDQRAADGAR